MLTRDKRHVCGIDMGEALALEHGLVPLLGAMLHSLPPLHAGPHVEGRLSVRLTPLVATRSSPCMHACAVCAGPLVVLHMSGCPARLNISRVHPSSHCVFRTRFL
jgi:hypothetical protein